VVKIISTEGFNDSTDNNNTTLISFWTQSHYFQYMYIYYTKSQNLKFGKFKYFLITTIYNIGRKYRLFDHNYIRIH
jgi:hypothetical protein